MTRGRFEELTDAQWQMIEPLLLREPESAVTDLRTLHGDKHAIQFCKSYSDLK